MSAERDVNRIVRSWIRAEEHESADRVLQTVLSRLDATPQRRSWWPTRRIAQLNKILPAAVAAAAVLVVAVVGYNLLPRTGGPGGPPTPSPSPGPLARGTFESHGGSIVLDAAGDGSNVTGTMTYTDVGGAALGGFVVDLTCTRSTDGGLILIGGPVVESTNGYVEAAPEGTNIALVLQRGSPIAAEIFIEHPDPHEPDCAAFLASISDERPAGALEPIEGTIELRP